MRLCSEREEWRGVNRSATLGNLIRYRGDNRVYRLSRVVSICDLWQSDQKLLGSDQREELRGGKVLVCLTESKRSAT